MSKDEWGKNVFLVCDDGWNAPGYEILIEKLASKKGCVAAAPLIEYAGYGTALCRYIGDINKKISVKRNSYLGVDKYGIDGPPALATTWILDKYLNRNIPFTYLENVLVSGVNFGPNIGRNIVHSGTFSAAFIASWYGVSAIAISLDDVYSVDENNPGALLFNVGANVAYKLLSVLSNDNYLINVNVPNTVSDLDNLKLYPAFPEGISCSDIPKKFKSDKELLINGKISCTVFHPASVIFNAAATQAVCVNFNE